MSDFKIRPLDVASDCEESLVFLRENFFPFEPCAKALDLCPIGYT